MVWRSSRRKKYYLIINSLSPFGTWVELMRSPLLSSVSLQAQSSATTKGIETAEWRKTQAFPMESGSLSEMHANGWINHGVSKDFADAADWTISQEAFQVLPTVGPDRGSHQRNRVWWMDFCLERDLDVTWRDKIGDAVRIYNKGPRTLGVAFLLLRKSLCSELWSGRHTSICSVAVTTHLTKATLGDRGFFWLTVWE